MEDPRKVIIDNTDIGKYLSMLYRHNRIFIDQQLTDPNFGSGQHIFLFFLKNHSGSTQEEISRALDIDKASTARAIQKLESHGFVRRQSDQDDRRINHVFLTEKGEALHTELKSISNHWKSIILDSFTEEEIIIIESYLKKLATNSILYRHKKEGQYDKHCNI
ncbi:MarR family winged helix-turn-helix transcriptional regulator [Fusibacter ferrireducens]|uniref:Winged helix-turn-helix transcriptional regulator n=1 Tax=Fusibacter ferrireducens TaxID=2785058 RepID=A0ABR9ZWZ7_9FIRM|nr:MarR family winged helix-turn-helix transcriptional regulator [Fusibacter ferrireducens]MBF4694976.1 winged helix-turn-helix transcriptional regulator [Fusibacter ferrireducens]